MCSLFSSPLFRDFTHIGFTHTGFTHFGFTHFGFTHTQEIEVPYVRLRLR